MDDHGDARQEPDDAAERRRRADQLHEEIERLKSGEADDPGRPVSPREFTDPGQRHHREREAPDQEDGAGDGSGSP